MQWLRFGAVLIEIMYRATTLYCISEMKTYLRSQQLQRFRLMVTMLLV